MDINKFIILPNQLELSNICDKTHIKYVEIDNYSHPYPQRHDAAKAFAVSLYSNLEEAKYKKHNFIFGVGTINNNYETTQSEVTITLINFIKIFENVKVLKINTYMNEMMWYLPLIQNMHNIEELCISCADHWELLVNVLNNSMIKKINCSAGALSDKDIDNFILLYKYCKKNSITIEIPESYIMNNCQNKMPEYIIKKITDSIISNDDEKLDNDNDDEKLDNDNDDEKLDSDNDDEKLDNDNDDDNYKFERTYL